MDATLQVKHLSMLLLLQDIRLLSDSQFAMEAVSWAQAFPDIAGSSDDLLVVELARGHDPNQVRHLVITILVRNAAMPERETNRYRDTFLACLQDPWLLTRLNRLRVLADDIYRCCRQSQTSPGSIDSDYVDSLCGFLRAEVGQYRQACWNIFVLVSREDYDLGVLKTHLVTLLSAACDEQAPWASLDRFASFFVDEDAIPLPPSYTKLMENIWYSWHDNFGQSTWVNDAMWTRPRHVVDLAHALEPKEVLPATYFDLIVGNMPDNRDRLKLLILRFQSDDEAHFRWLISWKEFDKAEPGIVIARGLQFIVLQVGRQLSELGTAHIVREAARNA